MNYKIEYLEEVFDQLAKIPKNIRQTIVKAIDERLSADPRRFKPLVCNLKGFFRMRVGNYRVIYHIEEKKVTVLIVKIDVRGNIYK
ncbi:MAG: type II toxin-antitoxin system RelE/ParE family toxin [Holosporales bacterium]|jgi:mRNA interferase RelE/StbE|nr:type II toxin-antitoxin system RelE/ParE family toxin [Holosporales bacterium]